MTGDTKTPPASLLGQGPGAYRLVMKRLLVYGLLWAWLVGVVALVGSGVSRPRIEAERAAMESVSGSGDMSTSTFRLGRGLHRIAWDAPCRLDVELWRSINGEDVFVYPLGRSHSRSVTFPIAETGRYFFSVGAACGWRIGVR